MRRDRKNLLWLQSGGCGGCTLSLICAQSPDLIAALDIAGIDLLWHPALSAATGTEVTAILEQVLHGETRVDIFCLEGSVVRGPNGSGRFHLMSGSGRPMQDVIAEIAGLSDTVVAVGNCAGFGGVTSGGVNPTDACGLSFEARDGGGLLGGDFQSASGLPVVNIPGCPTHPGWVTETLFRIAAGEFTVDDLDAWNRPRAITNRLVHHGCSRNEYYEFKASADRLSRLGCLMENLGCMGTQACGDCNTRHWNGGGSCISGGYPCIACTEPGFEEPEHAFTETPKVAGIPIGIPTDMPKAWFVALASLSKAATPERLKENAHSDHIRIPPAQSRRQDKS